jgi:hypothetical protein
MRLLLVSPAFVFLAACGSGANEPNNDIMNATSQMDPAAAAAVENATAQGVDPQNALAIGGEAATFENEPSAADRGQPVPPSMQARPNLVESPNRKDGTVPPDKTGTSTGQPGNDQSPG